MSAAELDTKPAVVDDEKRMDVDPEKHGAGAKAEIVDDDEQMARDQGVKPAFIAKVAVLNNAIKECGMGRYQWELFITAGFGWFADNIWLQGIAIIMPAVANEWIGYPHVRMATLALYAGLIVGAVFWGTTCDVWGRRIAWNMTLVIGGVFGICAAAAPNFVVFSTFIALIGFGVGGNLPVDGALFLEFLPGSHQFLLTLLSLWWAVGQVVASLISWAFLAKYGCASPPAGTFCTKESNMGWRYAYYTLGALMIFLWFIRFFIFPMDESPKFLVSIGKDAAAVAVVHRVAKRNGVTSTLTVHDLHAAAAPYLEGRADGTVVTEEEEMMTKFSTWELVKNSFSEINGEHTKGLFATPRLAYSTSLIIFIYGALGLAYPLFNGFLGTFLAQKNAELGVASLDATYSAYTYQAAAGVPGSMLAAFMIEWGRGGRKFAMAFFTIAAGIFLFSLTAARTTASVNALTAIASFWENAMYGVLYGYAPEVFPTPHRGTGDAYAAAASRVTGIFAPVIAVYSKAALTPNGPVYASASIFVVTGLVMLFLPIETYGHTAL
ncbi:MFS general substrate transporter [Clavulina sp. PMI_390]|nr:MFS general substrate transporter [Clavulina sp. PMI_390]